MSRIQLFIPSVFGISLFVFLGSPGSTVRAQDEAPAKGLTLADCLAVGLERQPALAAAQASLDAAAAGQRGVDNLPFFAGLLSWDLPIRRHQAALGVNIAAAGVDLAEWETRYAVTRNFFSVMYAHAQTKVLNSVIAKLNANHKVAKRVVDAGDPKAKITTIDLDNLSIAIEQTLARKVEAEVGMRRAFAALREAMGVDCHFPLDVLETGLPAPVSGFTCKETIALALDRRGELAQASAALDVTTLEIQAQKRLFFKLKAMTFAAGADLHSRPIPQGINNGEYRPGALGLEYPPFMIGKRGDRVDRAGAFNARANAVADKTENLVSLEAAAAFDKWEEAYLRINHFARARALALKVSKNVQDRFNDAPAKVAGDELIRAQTGEEQALALYNDALYLHALALANLERVTAGGLRPTYADRD